MLKNIVRRWLGLPVEDTLPVAAAPMDRYLHDTPTLVAVRIFQVRGGRLLQAARSSQDDPGNGKFEETVFVPNDADLSEAIKVELTTLALRGR